MNVVDIPIGGLKTVWPNVFAIAIDNTHFPRQFPPVPGHMSRSALRQLTAQFLEQIRVP